MKLYAPLPYPKEVYYPIQRGTTETHIKQTTRLDSESLGPVYPEIPQCPTCLLGKKRSGFTIQGLEFRAVSLNEGYLIGVSIKMIVIFWGFYLGPP